MKQLTEAHFRELQRFTAKHFVEYYDVQLELVDHLATAIEESWGSDPSISFEVALQREFKKFGVFGFTVLIENRQSDLQKYYYRKMWKCFKSFFGVPKIILTLALVYVIFFITTQLEDYADSFYLYIFSGLGLLLTLDLYVYHRKIKRQQKETQKKWLIESVSLQVFGWTLLGMILNMANLLRMVTSMLVPDFQYGVKAIVLVFSLLLGYVIKWVIQPMIEIEIRDLRKRFKSV